MSDNLVLEMLRAIRGDIAELKADHQEFRERFGFLEGMAASTSRRIDRIAGDVERIKRRLDLVDETT